MATRNGLDVLGAEPDPAAAAVAQAHSRKRTITACVTAIALALIWRKHRVLGALGGLALGKTGYNLYAGTETPWEAAEGLVPHAAAIGGALLVPSNPSIAYVGAGAVSALAIGAARGDLTGEAHSVVIGGFLPAVGRR